MPSPSVQSHPTVSLPSNGDGFTSEEVEAVVHPPTPETQPWSPPHEYEDIDAISSLEQGPRSIAFMGRIVNLYEAGHDSKKLSAARGCWKLMIGDDTGAITVRLWYSSAKYNFQLGQLVSVWTVHVSHAGQTSLASATAPLFTSIFPERERSCHVMVHHKSDSGTFAKQPVGTKGSQVAGLITLKNFVDGGHDVEGCKLLLCVKSIGARRKFTNKKQVTSESVSVVVFDDTADGVLTLYGASCSSAFQWQPSHTILLLSNPGWRIDRTVKLSLSSNSRLDIDPDFRDAAWLRSLGQRLTKREHVNPPFPEGIREIDDSASVRILYTLSDIDECTRANPSQQFAGYTSVLITELNMVTNFKRNMLMCTECCGVPLYANSTSATCKQCEQVTALRINPRVLGPVVDETGQIASGKLVLSDGAWEQMLGRTAAQLVETDVRTLQYLEQRMLFLRVSIGFAIVGGGEVERLCVWGVRM